MSVSLRATYDDPMWAITTAQIDLLGYPSIHSDNVEVLFADPSYIIFRKLKVA
jgi:hypothetical protein